MSDSPPGATDSFSRRWASNTVLATVSTAPPAPPAFSKRLARIGSLENSRMRAFFRSDAMPWLSPTAFSIGTSNQKVEPWPGCESTPIWPDIRSMMRLQITRPRPVPPYRRVVEASAWLKALNRPPAFSGAMPMPVSLTSKRSTWCWRVSDFGLTESVTEPLAVNFMALPSRLLSTCRNRTGSPRRARRRPGSRLTWMAMRLASAWLWNICTTELTTSRMFRPVVSSCSLLASSLE